MATSVTINEVIPGVLHLLFNSRMDLTLSLCRIEEFYESPYPNINRQVFTFEEFIETYGQTDGTVSYFGEWEGFNVPKDVIDLFFTLYKNQLTKREQQIYEMWTKEGSTYKYLVATEIGSDPSTIHHEVAHARWSLEPEYRARSLSVIEWIPEDILVKLKSHLIEHEYPGTNDELLNDEVHAYLRTSRSEELVEMFPSVDIDVLLDFQALFLGVI